MKKIVTITPGDRRLRKPLAIQLLFTLANFMLLAFVMVPQSLNAQSTAAFLEDNGLVVMETESVPRPFNWNFENVEEGHTGSGYVRYIGSNHFNDPGIDILEFKVVIEHPGEYKMFMFGSHLGAPEPDQENDCWTRMNDGEWIKTVHPGAWIDEGFSFHSQWVTFVDGVETFSQPTYQLDAGVHTFQVSGRSWNYRIDRIHIWKNDDPFKISYNDASLNTHPESARDNTILTVTPDPITFSPTAVGIASQIVATLNNEGDESINVSSVAITGDNASEYSTDFSGSATVPAEGSIPLMVTLGPTTHGTKVATMTITHDGLNSPTVVNLFGTGTSGVSGTTVLLRVNAGGPLVSDVDGDWEEDQTAIELHNSGDTQIGTPHQYVNALANGDWAFGRVDVVTPDFSVPPGTPSEIFNSGRWDPLNLPTQQWDIPIDAGKEIEVRLYFAEQLFTAPDVPVDRGWPRIFDVSIDGIVYASLDDLNIFEEVGHDVGMMRSVVIVSDGNLDIDLINDSMDPIIQGIEILEVGSISRVMQEGWNLVGVPTDPPSDVFTSVFNEVSIDDGPYAWDGAGYGISTNVTAGTGYWLDLGASGSQSFTDATVNDLSISVVSGWNLISGPGCVISADDISDPSNVLIDGTLYSYDGAYNLSTALLPGSGYWVQATGSGTISMDCASAGKVSNLARNNAPNIDDFGMLAISDEKGKRQDLYFGSTLKEGIDARRFVMPPQAQRGGFDARFNDHTKLAEGSEQYIQIQSSDYPVTVKLERVPFAMYGNLVVDELVSGNVVRTHDLGDGEEVEIADMDVQALRIRSVDDLVQTLPESFALQGNYPNPFNPSTQVVFDMPEAGVVQVEVFDMLGRSVLSVPAQDVAAGAGRQIMIDASSLASGMYLYHLKVEMASQTVNQVSRMTLIK